MKRLLWCIAILSLLLCGLSACRQEEKVITRLDDAAKAKIGIMIGSIGERIVKERFPEADVKSFDDVMDGVAAMKSGQLEAIVTMHLTAVQVVKKNPELTFLPEPLKNEDLAIALRKGDDRMRADLDRIIGELEADGTLNDIRKRWFKTEPTPYEEPPITLPLSGEPLKIGVCATREPLTFVDKDGRISGHDGELARRIAVRLQRPIEFINMKFMALVPALQTGKVDMILSGLTATAERRQLVDFTRPYLPAPQVMVVKAGKPGTAEPVAAASALPDLDGKRIAVLTGSAGDRAARKNFPGAQFMDFTTGADASLAIMTRRADVFIHDRSVLMTLVNKSAELTILPKSVMQLEIAVALRKDNAALLSEINQVLQDLKTKGELQRLKEKWVLSQRKATDLVTLSASSGDAALRKGLLRMGTCARTEPFSFLSHGQYVGLDAELGRMIGEHLGKDVEIVDMEFSSLIPALQSGKIDFAMSNFSVTEERKKSVSFSMPYIVSDISVLGRLADFPPVSGPGAGKIVLKPEESFFQSLAHSFHSNLIEEKRYLLIWDGLQITVLISIFACIFGTLLGAVICFMRLSKQPVLSTPAKLYIAILRGMPVLVLLMLIFYVVFASVNINPVLVAIIAFGLNFSAYSAEIFRSGIEGIDKGQTEAGISIGFTPSSTFFYIVLPQMIQRILPVYKGEFISLVKMTSIVGYIAVQDLTKASDIIRSRTFDAFFPLVMVAILYFLISWLLMQALEYLERQTDPRIRRIHGGQK